MLKRLIDANGIKQAELADGIDRSAGFVSRLLRGKTRASQDTVDAILEFLSKRLRKNVTYEMVFRSRPRLVAPLGSAK